LFDTDWPAQIAAMAIGLNAMPAYLDFKMRTVPEKINGFYFGIADIKMECQRTGSLGIKPT
jgi:hypothetical protein